MILKKVEIKNFFLIEKSEVLMGDGLFHLIGQNHDDIDSQSNGSGKSSFCEAILWALTGDTIRKDLAKNDVIGPHDKWCQVTLDLEKDGQHIKIVRWRNKPGERSNDPRVYVDGADLSQHKNTDAKIEQILGFNSKMLSLAGFHSSRKESFAELSGPKKLLMLKEALQLEKYDLYDQWLKKGINSLERELSNLEKDIGHKIELSERILEQKDSILKRVEYEKEQKLIRIKALEEQIAELQVKNGKILGMRERFADAEAKLDDLRPKKVILSNVPFEIREIDVKLEKARAELEKASKEHRDEQLGLIKANEGIDNLTVNIYGNCQYCGSELRKSNSYAKKLAYFQQAKEHFSRQELFALELVNDAKLKVDELIEERKQLHEKLREFKDLVAEEEKISNWLKRSVAMQGEVLVNEALIREKQSLCLQLVDQTEYDWQAESQSLDKRYNEMQHEIMTLTFKAEDVKISIDDYNFVRTLCKKAKKERLDFFVEDLVGSINYYLDKICGSIECQVFLEKDDLELQFNRSNSGWRPFSLFSDGEAVKISKSISLALNQVFGIGFMIDDEGLGGLDTQGSQLILDFLTQEDFLGTMIFVSHDANVKDSLKDKVQIQASKKNEKIEVKRL